MSTDSTAPTPHPEPTPHPDRDALADYAAGVLTDTDRDAVGRHTHDCAQCRADLAEIEDVHALLLADDPGPMPDDVWTRLASALAEESERRDAATDAGPHVSAAGADPAAPALSSESTSASASASASGETIVPDAAAGPASVVSILRPGADPVLRRPTGRAQRATALGRRRLYPTLSAAAALVVLLGGLAVAVQVWSPDDDHAPATTADLALPHAERQALADAIRTTGTDYTSSALASQVRALLTSPTDGSRPAMGGRQDAPRRSGDEERAGDQAWSASPKAPAPAASRGAAYAEDGGVLRDPEALNRCLVSLDADPANLVAVDLATFEGRQAAIVVLGPPSGKDLEVYAVSRNCGVDGADDGAFSFSRVSR